MRQAIAEGFILDVLANYTTYAVYYKLANAHPRNDPEMETRKGRAALARFARRRRRSSGGRWSTSVGRIPLSRK